MGAKTTKEELLHVISSFSEKGIQADRKHLIENIGAQFANFREWIREYVVNAFDAKATWCRVSGEQSGDTITIYVDDNGHGMDEKGVLDFMTLFRSVKKGGYRKTIGRFGVGKASILAIPNLSKLSLQTSTGKESWYLDTHSLADDSPVTLKQFAPVPPQGTQFGVSFQKEKEMNLEDELKRLGDILEKYVRFLTMTIMIQEDFQDSESGEHQVRLRSINCDWSDNSERFRKRYSFSHNRKNYTAILSVGSPVHELYQNDVLITDRYNLVSHDLRSKGERFVVPHLRIRIDSPDFELPFGRHCLRNESVLDDITSHIRINILPDYFETLCFYHRENGLEEIKISTEELEDIACCLINHRSNTTCSWSNLPVFSIVDGTKLSLVELIRLQKAAGKLYLEDGENPGLDYSIFTIPVLSKKQPAKGLSFLRKFFQDNLINLGLSDVIIEKPGNGEDHLGPDEKAFQSQIGFHPDVPLDLLNKKNGKDGKNNSNPGNSEKSSKKLDWDMKTLEMFAGLNETTKSARKELETINWRVNYLVERDGKTPCLSHKFLYQNNTVVLNLNHLETQKLLLLSKMKPELAGHWSLAMCLTESNKILSHLSPESREELIKLDGIARTLSITKAAKSRDQKKNKEAKRVLDSFMKNINFNDYN
jgi:hypothetical protein